MGPGEDVAIGLIRAPERRRVGAFSRSGGAFNGISIAAKISKTGKAIFSAPSIPRMFEILQECTLARFEFLEKKKQEASRRGEASL
jgi:hypothetical protein